LRISVIYIALCFILGSCIKEIPYDRSAQTTASHAVHCFITPDSIIISDCRLTAPFGSKDAPVAGADFSIRYPSGQIMDSSLYSGNGLHIFKTNTLQSGDSFIFRGNIRGQQSFEIHSAIPNAISILKLDTSRQIIPGIGRAFSVAVRFSDNPVNNNFYRCFLYKTSFRYVYDYTGTLSDSFLKKEIIALFSNEFPVAENDFNNYTSREVLFSDASFNGVNNNMVFYTSDPLVKNKQERPVGIEFHLENIDKNLFDFYNTRNAHIWQQQSISQLPGSIIGNIPGMYGVMGGYTKDYRSVNLKR
jgi:hypothetical protein